MDFDLAFEKLLGNEGGYSFNSMDPGGETMWGVTARVARANGYAGEMKAMTKDIAKGVYRKLYWDAVRAEELDDPVAFLMFDASVNSGVTQAVKWLQRAVGTSEDGVLGPVTLKAARQMDSKTLGMKLIQLRLDFMTSLPTWGAFGKGWTRRMVGNLEYTASC